MDDVPDKSFMNYHFTNSEYRRGVANFINFVATHNAGKQVFPCPCLVCKNIDVYQIPLLEIYHHCSHFGLDPTYTVWDKHGEVSTQAAVISQRRQWLQDRAGASNHAGPSVNPHLEIIQDVFPYYLGYHEGAPHDPIEENFDMDEMVANQSSGVGESVVTSPIPMEEHVAVIEKEMGDGKSGMKHRGLGNAAKRRAKQRGGAHVPRESAHVASMEVKLNAVEQELADLKAKVSVFLAAQGNMGGDVVVASPNVASKSSQAGNHDLDDDDENDEHLC